MDIKIHKLWSMNKFKSRAAWWRPTFFPDDNKSWWLWVMHLVRVAGEGHAVLV